MTMEICCDPESTTRVPVGSMSSSPIKISRMSVSGFPWTLTALLTLYSSASGIVILANMVSPSSATESTRILVSKVSPSGVTK